jgi:hypothetical protein
MKLSLRVLLLAIAFLASSVSAQTVRGTPNEIFRPISKHIVQQLVDLGIKKVGMMDVEKLLADLETVEWRTFSLGFFAGSGGKRQTSIYLVEQRMVAVSTYALDNLVGQPIPLWEWALHEALGALGYPDENYELTTSLHFLVKNNTLETSQRINFVEESFSAISIRTTNQIYSSEGGTTIIGGGGDAPIITFKTQLLDYYFNWVDANHSELSKKKKKQGFNRLVAQAIEFDLIRDYSTADFSIRDNVVWLGIRGNSQPELILNDEYMATLLTALAPYLFE